MRISLFVYLFCRFRKVDWLEKKKNKWFFFLCAYNALIENFPSFKMMYAPPRSSHSQTAIIVDLFTRNDEHINKRYPNRKKQHEHGNIFWLSEAWLIQEESQAASRTHSNRIVTRNYLHDHRSITCKSHRLIINTRF